MIKMIIWDMDGTMADLYGVENWLPMLRAENPMPYEVAEPMFDMDRLADLLARLMDMGVENRVVSWLSKDSSESYKREVRKAKVEWLEKYNFPYNKFHGVQYGATKADSVRKLLHDGEEAILIDDNDKVRAGWHLGRTLNPQTDDVIGFLADLLRMEG